MTGGRNPKFEWQDAFMRADVKPSAFKVGQAIANRWNGDRNQPFASVPYLVKVTGLSRATVNRALRELRDKGWIAQASRGGRRGETAVASRWRLTVPNGSSGIPNGSPVSSQRLTSEPLVDLSSRPVSRHSPPDSLGSASSESSIKETRAHVRDKCPEAVGAYCIYRCEVNAPCIQSLQLAGCEDYAHELIQSLNLERSE